MPALVSFGMSRAEQEPVLGVLAWLPRLATLTSPSRACAGSELLLHRSVQRQ